MLPLNRYDLTSASSVASSIGDDVESIAAWDSLTHGWKQYLEGFLSTDFEVNTSDGLLIYKLTEKLNWNKNIELRDEKIYIHIITFSVCYYR